MLSFLNFSFFNIVTYISCTNNIINIFGTLSGYFDKVYSISWKQPLHCKIVTIGISIIRFFSYKSG